MTTGRQWRLEAKCAGMNPNYFFPVVAAPRTRRSLPRNQDGIEAGVARFCLGTTDGIACPVRQNCLAFALENRMDDGVWGGLTRNQRAKISRSRRVS